jgi:peptide deformylase
MEIQINKIIKYPNPTLKLKSEDILEINSETLNLYARLIKNMQFYQAAGISAIQIGTPLKMFAIANENQVFINPEILETSGEAIHREGCLSFPEVYVVVKRPERVKLKYTNLAGKELVEDFTGFDARVILHEEAHLRGKTFLDEVTSFKFQIAKDKINKLIKSGRWKEYDAIVDSMQGIEWPITGTGTAQ